MTGPERGYLLLCADLADGRKPLTLAQLRSLRRLVQQSEPDRSDPDRPITAGDLRRAGLSAAAARRVLDLLEREDALAAYLKTAALFDIYPLTCISPGYPRRLVSRLGQDAPAVLFLRGNAALLRKPAVSLTGSRVLDAAAAAFARRVGALAASEGKVLVSGNAQGADRTAQAACLEAGGEVIAVVPGELENCVPASDRELYVCEAGWHIPFAPYRALERNRLIYALALHALIARTNTDGGTFSGASDALRRGNCRVSVRDDGSPGSRALIARGACPVRELETLEPPPETQLPLSPRP